MVAAAVQWMERIKGKLSRPVLRAGRAKWGCHVIPPSITIHTSPPYENIFPFNASSMISSMSGSVTAPNSVLQPDRWHSSPPLSV